MKLYAYHLGGVFFIVFSSCFGGFFVHTSHAQVQSKYASFDHYTVQAGLPSNTVRALLQDRRGFIWVGTNQGVVRYDGYEFASITHPDSLHIPVSYIGELYEDAVGNIWIGGREGLMMYDPIVGHIQHFSHDPNDTSTLSHNNVFAIIEAEEGSMWIGTENGLNLLDLKSGNIERFFYDKADSSSLCGNLVTSIVRDANNTFWFGTEGGLCSFDPKLHSFTYWKNFATNGSNGNNRLIRALYLDDPQTLWVGSHEGLFSFDIEKKQFKEERITPLNTSVVSEVVLSFKRTPQNTLIVGMLSGELCEKNPVTNEWTSIDYNGESSFFSNTSESIRTLLIDDNGLLWIGVYGEGVYKHNPRKDFQSYDFHPESNDSSLSHPEVTAIHSSNTFEKEIWVGTNGGGLNLVNTNTGVISHYKNDQRDARSLSNDRVMAIEESSDGTLWLGTPSGLNYANLDLGKPGGFNQLHARNSDLPTNFVNSILEDQSNRIWLGTSVEGIIALKKEDQTIHIDPFLVNKDSLSHYTVWPILKSKISDYFWMGTSGGGINILDMKHEPPKLDRTLLGDSLFRAIDYVLNLHEDRNGHVWIGTLGHGLLRYNAHSKHVDQFKVTDGLPHNSVSCIQSDYNGHVWIGTYDGLASLENDSTIYRFTERDGLPGSFFFENACMVDTDGELYFGTNNGLLTFDPAEILIDDHPPEVVITGVDLYNEPIKLDTSLVHKKVVHLKHDENYLTVHFSGLHFATPEENKYFYTLEGVDRDWIPAGSDRRFANYTSLFPGTYQFRARASNSDGVWATEEAVITFIIAKPFWQMWWFFVLCALSTFLLFWLIHRYRVYHLLKLERARQQISADLHDNIGGSLTSIALFLEGLARRFRSDPTQEYRINYHARTSRQLVDDLRDTVWVVNTDYDSLPELVHRMQQLADHAATDIAVYFQLIGGIPDLPLKMDLRRNLLFIYKEALHNAIRHAEASKIDVSVNYDKDHFSFEVKDNGVGFNDAAIHEGRGLKNYYTRAAAIKGTLEIDSTIGIGTKIRLSIKLPHKTGVYS